MDKDDDKYQAVLTELSKIFEAWRGFQERMHGEVAEYKKTVNNAISLLAKEMLDLQANVTKQFDSERQERMARQRRTDYKDYAVIVGMGCLMVLGTALLVAVLVFIWIMLSQGGPVAIIR